MAMDGYSLSDIKAVTDGGMDGGFGGSWMWIIVLFLFIFGRNGFGFGGGAGEALTQAELQRGFDNNTIVNKLDGISNGLCDGFYAQNTTMLQGFNGVGSQIANLGYQTQQCC